MHGLMSHHHYHSPCLGGHLPNSPTKAIGAVRQNMLRNRDVCLAYVRGTERGKGGGGGAGEVWWGGRVKVSRNEIYMGSCEQRCVHGGICR